jgi:two-component system sensor histidine kinase CiaH
MFTRARIKLTLWYLLIIMLVSVMFSAVIYRLLTGEIERFERLQRVRMERRILDFAPPPFQLPQTAPELMEETRQRILLMLALVNCGIFVFSGILGYVLAGKTLSPIKDMIDEQNRFISDASHELRTPLTSLKSGFEVYLRDKNPDIREAKTLASESIEEVNNLQALSDSLLTLAQYDKPNESVACTSLGIREVIKAAVKKITPRAKKKHIVFSVKVKNILVYGDKQSLIDVFAILLDNAVKYSLPKAEVSLTSSTVNGFVEISVKDNGIGISKDNLPHIFKRFYRADNARSKTQKGGYGLGLAIAQKIAFMHQGDIRVISTLGRGSTFTVRLPKQK